MVVGNLNPDKHARKSTQSKIGFNNKGIQIATTKSDGTKIVTK